MKTSTGRLLSRRWRISLALLLVAVLAALASSLFSAREPAYHGKRLGVWVEQYYQEFDSWKRTGTSEARTAVRTIGTNGLPALLRMLGATDPPLKRKILALAKKQSLVTLPMRPAEHYRWLAGWGFSALGPMAKPAVPAIIELLKDKDPAVRAAAAHAFSSIGPEAEAAVPALVRCLDDRNNGLLQINAMMALGSIHTNGELAVPVLIEYLEGPRREWNYWSCAIQALSLYGEVGQADAAIPVLQRLVEDPDPNIRDAAARALRRMKTAAAKPLAK